MSIRRILCFFGRHSWIEWPEQDNISALIVGENEPYKFYWHRECIYCPKEERLEERFKDEEKTGRES